MQTEQTLYNTNYRVCDDYKKAKPRDCRKCNSVGCQFRKRGRHWWFIVALLIIAIIVITVFTQTFK
jgi:hypothetical protein